MAGKNKKILIIGKGWLGSRCAGEWSDVAITAPKTDKTAGLRNY